MNIKKIKLMLLLSVVTIPAHSMLTQNLVKNTLKFSTNKNLLRSNVGSKKNAFFLNSKQKSLFFQQKTVVPNLLLGTNSAKNNQGSTAQRSYLTSKNNMGESDSTKNWHARLAYILLGGGALYAVKKWNDEKSNIPKVLYAADNAMDKQMREKKKLGVKLLIEWDDGRMWVLFNLIQEGADSKKIEKFIGDNVDEVFEDDNGVEYTPLRVAIRCGNKEAVELLLEKGANLGDPNNKFVLLSALRGLMWTNDQNAQDIFKLILQKKNKGINEQDDRGIVSAPIIEVLSSKLVDGQKKVLVLKFLKSQGAKLNLKRSFDGATPLIIALEREDIEVANWLIKHGADVNEANKWGRPPLLIALDQGNIEGASLLIEHGAYVNLADSLGCSPLKTLAYPWITTNTEEATRLNLMEQLLKKNSQINEAALVAYIRFEQLAGFKLLMAQNPHLTPKVFEAAFDLEDRAFANLLLKQASKESLPKLLEAALVQAKSIQDVTLLLEYGTSIDAVVDGNSCLSYAAQRGDYQLVKFLIEQGADVHQPTGYDGDRTALVHAVMFRDNITKDRANIIKFLSNKGALQKNLALRYATSWGNLGASKVLIECGADISHNDYEAFRGSCRLGHSELVSYYLSKKLIPVGVVKEVLNFLTKYAEHPEICKILQAYKQRERF